MQIILDYLLFFYLKRVVFLAQIAHDDGLTVIIVIHDLNLALRYCDRFLFIHNGGVYRYGDERIITSELLSDVYQVDAKVLNILGRKSVFVE